MKIKSVKIALLALLVALLSFLPLSAEMSTLYVSGIPDAYPVEAYDKGQKAYVGYIPALLSEFGKEYGYSVVYISDGKDSRQSHLKNAQADLITAASGEFEAVDDANGVTVLHSGETYRLLFTDATSETLKGQLSAFLSTLTEEQQNALWLQVAGGTWRAIPTSVVFIVAGVALLLLAAVILLAVLLKKARSGPKDEDLDVLTDVYNFRYLEKFYGEKLKPECRSLYHGIYFGVHLKREREDLNAILKTMSALLRSTVTEDSDVLSRVNDGFFILKSHFGTEAIYPYAQKTTDMLNAELKSKHFSALVTAGIYNIGAHDKDVEKLISNTAYCCRYARKVKKTFLEYSKEVEQAEKEEERLTNDLKTAFQYDEFAIYLQFFVNTQNGKILGAEALSRWNHPDMGTLSPAKYIELIEKERLYDVMDFTILRKVCETLEEANKITEKPFFLACNFSRNTIVKPDFVAQVEAIVSEYRFPKGCLLFEVTEYASIENTTALFDNIRGVKELGIKVVIDDFGTGFSDLLDIGKVKFDGVKLDRSLISGTHTEADDLILKSLIDLMHSLGMTVIAEGIENVEQAERLLRAGCHVSQGFCYYLPLPKLEALRVLANKKES